MRHTHAALAVLSIALGSACSKPERIVPVEAVDSASAAVAASDGPIEPGGFPTPPDGSKLVMSAFGQVIVADNFQAGESGFVAPAGFTPDTSYVARGPDGSISARFAISHKDDPGTAVPDPDIAHLTEKSATAAPCPGWASDVAQKEFVRGSVAHFRCAKGAFGGGLSATLRKDQRVYELLCTATGDDGAVACIKILGQLRPG